MGMELLCKLMTVKGRLETLAELDAQLFIGEAEATHVLDEIKEVIDKVIAGELDAK